MNDQALMTNDSVKLPKKSTNAAPALGIGHWSFPFGPWTHPRSALSNQDLFWQTSPVPANEHIRNKLSQLPHKPGVYLMKDRFGTVIYVGKARDLRRRVSQY